MDETEPLVPLEIVAKVFSYLGEARDIAVGARVCQAWREAASMPHIWKELAVRRYGRVVAETTVSLYVNDWRDMLKDDNRKGALPALNPATLWFYRYNMEQYYYAGVVVAIKWHRPSREIRVYIEARGERDLRHPGGSTVQRTSDQQILYGEWKPDLKSGGDAPGHHKGCLVFQQQFFLIQGDYTFCYANLNHETGDYSSKFLLHIASPGPRGLEEAFSVPDSPGFPNMTYTLDDSPFCGDTRESELFRWKSAFHSYKMFETSFGLFERLRSRGWFV